VAACKLQSLNKLSRAGVSIPDFTVSKPTEGKWVARTILNANSGVGAVVAEASELPNAPLYTKYIPKDAEFRVIVVDGKVVDAKQKLKRRDFEGERQPYIWSCDNGYVMARQVDIPDNITQLGVDAVNALGLIIGAVDIIVKDNTAYVLEINSAPGLAGTTIELVGDAIAKYIRGL
jgi:glutathione synthase/RimK-type ligase-like ATP-grasp enzyme